MTQRDAQETRSSDLTPRLLKFRGAARHLWNCFLREHERDTYVPDDFILDRWEAIQDELFAALVLRYTRGCGPPAIRRGPRPLR